MSLREILRLSFEALLANRFRAGLTMLGMIIAVSAVVLLVSIGTGAKRYVMSEFEGLGTNLIIVQPGKTDKKSSFGPPIGAAQRKMTIEDVVAIEKRSFNVQAVTGIVFGSASIKHEGNTNNASIFGANDLFLDIISLKLGLGQWYSREEDDYGRRVAVLGANIAQDLFGDDYSIGRSIRINQSEFRVIGVMAKSGDKLGLNFDEFAFIPTRAALRLFNDDKLFGIRARASSKAGVDEAVSEISEILKERRDGEEDFTIVTQGAMLDTMSNLLNMLTYVLGAIAAISMLVGGIGIMNIMLVSVAERTSEIGVRRAVGARTSDIMKQFLAEAVTLSVLGGAIGLTLAIAITHLIYFFVPAFDLRAPLWILFPAFAVSVGVGVIFGVWPARIAAKIETLDALRYE